MAHWDDEQFHTQEPPKDIPCATCKYRLKPVVIQGETVDRATYGICGKYERKPVDILYGHIPCALHEKGDPV